MPYQFLPNEIKTTDVLLKLDENRIILYRQVDSAKGQTQSIDVFPVDKLREIINSPPGTQIEFNCPPGGTNGTRMQDFNKYVNKYEN